MKKDVIFFSNPFGFGPTAKAIALINICKKYWNVNLHYVTNMDCMQIFNDPDVHVIMADQRNPNEIQKVLSRFSEPYVISSLNRFAIKVAHEHDIPNCFIDSLTWMWNIIPEDYLLTDLYFALNFPGLDEKLKIYPTLIKVPYIIDSVVPSNNYFDSDLLVNVGGCMNPLTKECPKSFLTLVSLALNEIKGKKILICGGAEAISFVTAIVDKNIQCLTLKKDIFLSSLLHSKHFLTTSGLNASLEAFYYNVPTSFLMPTNLSQWENLQIFSKNNAANSKVNWEDITYQDLNIHGKTERESIQKITSVAEKILNNHILKKTAIDLIKSVSNINSNQISQKKFVESLGINGADVISTILKEKWSL